MSCSSDEWAENIIGRAHSCPWAGDPALTQPFGSTASPPPLAPNQLMKGMDPTPLFASQEPLSWQRVGFDFGWKGGEQLPSVRLSPAPLHGSAARSSLQIQGRGITPGRGVYQNTLQSSSLAANITLTSFLGE